MEEDKVFGLSWTMHQRQPQNASVLNNIALLVSMQSDLLLPSVHYKSGWKETVAQLYIPSR